MALRAASPHPWVRGAGFPGARRRRDRGQPRRGPSRTPRRRSSYPVCATARGRAGRRASVSPSSGRLAGKARPARPPPVVGGAGAAAAAADGQGEGARAASGPRLPPPRPVPGAHRAARLVVPRGPAGPRAALAMGSPHPQVN